jgi:hypothetical protein
MVNKQENQIKSMICMVDYILGRGSECPDPLDPPSLDLSFPQKYPQVSWKIFDSFRDGNLTGEAAKRVPSRFVLEFDWRGLQ